MPYHLMQHRLILIVAIVTIICPSAARSDGPQPVCLQVAGHEVTGPPAPRLADDLLWGPVGAVTRCLGAAVDWKLEERRLTTTTSDGQQFRFAAGCAFFERGEKRLSLPAAMTVTDDMLVAPLAQIIEAFGVELSSDGQRRHFYVTVPVAEPVIRGDQEGLVIELATFGRVAEGVQYLDNPPRAFVDIAGARPHSPTGKRYIGQVGVWRMRWGQFSSQPPIARYVLDLAEEQEVTWLPRDDGRGGALIVGKFDGDEPELPVRCPELENTRISQTSDEATAVTMNLSLPAETHYDVLRQPWRIRVNLRDVRAPEKLLRHLGSGEFVKGLEVISTDEGVKVDIYLHKLIGFDFQTGWVGGSWSVKLTFRQQQLCDKLIMIDPGHGGKDTGARGRKLLEKDVNLDVSTRVGKRLVAAGSSVVLTRDRDVFVKLFDRVNMAANYGADAFVSVHANAMPEPDTNWGTETYYYTPQSKMLAVIIHQELLKALGRKDNGVRQARFVVVREPEMPSVLVELMYLNCREEEQLLAQPQVRAAAAEAIVRGLFRYYEGQPEAQDGNRAGELAVEGQVKSANDKRNGGQ